MALSESVNPSSSVAADYATPEPTSLWETEDDDAFGQQINERRAQAENAEALRLARAIYARAI